MSNSIKRVIIYTGISKFYDVFKEIFSPYDDQVRLTVTSKEDTFLDSLRSAVYDLIIIDSRILPVRTEQDNGRKTIYYALSIEYLDLLNRPDSKSILFQMDSNVAIDQMMQNVFYKIYREPIYLSMIASDMKYLLRLRSDESVVDRDGSGVIENQSFDIIVERIDELSRKIDDVQTGLSVTNESLHNLKGKVKENSKMISKLVLGNSYRDKEWNGKYDDLKEKLAELKNDIKDISNRFTWGKLIAFASLIIGIFGSITGLLITFYRLMSK